MDGAHAIAAGIGGGARLDSLSQIEAAFNPSEPSAFANILGVRRPQGGDAAEEARTAAEEFVAISLVQPILEQLRETNEAAPPFAPGPAERMFGPILDAEIAQRIVQKSGYDLVDAVARQLLKAQRAPAAQAALATPGLDAHA